MNTTKHPGRLYLMTALVMLIMLAFETTLSLLVLYCTHGLHMSDGDALKLFAVYAALLYATPICAGFIIERFITAFNALFLGSCIAGISLSVLAFGADTLLVPGLSGFVIATAFMVPSLYILLGHCYSKNDHRRESGFTLFYMGMNLGALIAIDSAAIIQKQFGYHASFTLAAAAMLTVLLLLISGYRFFPKTQNIKLSTHRAFIIVIATAILWSVLYTLMHHADLNNALVIGITLAGMATLWLLSRQFPQPHKRQAIAFLLLCLFAIAFWSLYMLAPSLLTLFIDRHVNHHLLGLPFPTSMALSLNAFFILLIGAFMTRLWLILAKRNLSPSIGSKFSLAIALMAGGYLMLAAALWLHHSSTISMWWIVISYLLQTAGELCLSPTGLALIGQIAPKAYEGYMLSLWNVMTGVGAVASGYISKEVINPHHHTDYQTNFLVIGAITLLVALLVTALTPTLKRLLAR